MSRADDLRPVQTCLNPREGIPLGTFRPDDDKFMKNTVCRRWGAINTSHPKKITKENLSTEYSSLTQLWTSAEPFPYFLVGQWTARVEFSRFLIRRFTGGPRRVGTCVCVSKMYFEKTTSKERFGRGRDGGEQDLFCSLPPSLPLSLSRWPCSILPPPPVPHGPR